MDPAAPLSLQPARPVQSTESSKEQRDWERGPYSCSSCTRASRAQGSPRRALASAVAAATWRPVCSVSSSKVNAVRRSSRM